MDLTKVEERAQGKLILFFFLPLRQFPFLQEYPFTVFRTMNGKFIVQDVASGVKGSGVTVRSLIINTRQARRAFPLKEEEEERYGARVLTQRYTNRGTR